MSGVNLEVVTPDGVAVRETDLQCVVVRRAEPGFDHGGELAIYPTHAPMVARLVTAPVRFARGDETRYLVVDGGLAQVLRDEVLIVTPRCMTVSPLLSDPARAAEHQSNVWLGEEALVGRLAGWA